MSNIHSNIYLFIFRSRSHLFTHTFPNSLTHSLTHSLIHSASKKLTDEELHKYDKYVEMAMSSAGGSELESNPEKEMPPGLRKRESRISDVISEAIEDFKS